MWFLNPDLGVLNTKTKHIQCLIAAVVTVLLLCCFPGTADAADSVSEGACGISIKWTLDSEGLLTISGSGKMEDYSWGYAPWDSTRIQQVVIEEGVTSIGDSAFMACQRLTGVTLPDSITSIGRQAFAYCHSLESVDIPDGVLSIGEQAFYECEKLKSITVPQGVTAIEAQTFQNCKALECVVLLGGITRIGDKAFYECTRLTALELPGDLEQIGNQAFGACIALKHMEIPEGTKGIGAEVFKDCTTLQTVSLPESLTALGTGAFYGCENLTGIVIPDGITYLERNLFVSCYRMTSVELPDGLTGIGPMAFASCQSLEHIEIPKGVTSLGYGVFQDCESLKTLEIPEGVTELDMWFAAWCDELQSVKLPQTLTYIADYAFEFCPILGRIEIPFGVTAIGGSVFRGCTALEKVTLPEGLTSLGSEVFRDCESLTHVEFPDTAVQIGEYAFLRCGSLKSVRLPMELTAIPAGMFEGCVSLAQIDIPGSVISIGHSAFVECESLKQVVIPPGVTELEKYTFYSCIRITDIVLPEGLTEIGDGAFFHCESLRELTIPQGVVKLGNEAFYSCLSLEEMELPEGITRVTPGMFYNCINLKRVQLPQTITSIDSMAFYNCYNLTNVEIPDDVTAISDNAFAMCTGLEGITLPQKLEYIGQSAFGYCVGLKWVELPISTVEIANGAFYACVGLKDISYQGSWQKRQGIAVGYDNECLTQAQWSYSHEGVRYGLDEANGILIIPEEHEIPDYFLQDPLWEDLRGQIRSIVLGDQTSVIGQMAFADLPELEGVYLGDQVVRIGPDAFRDCPKLTIHGPEEGCGRSHAEANGIDFSSEHQMLLVAIEEVSCEDDGTELYRCGVCGREEKTVTREKLGHSPIPISGEAPLCKRVGLTEGSACGVCGKILQEQTVLPMDPDSHYYEGIRTEPTCTEDGYTIFTCVLCGNSYVGNHVAAAHRYTAVVTDPDCTQQGYITYTCRCGDSYTNSYREPLGHNWDEGVVTVEPTEEMEGMRQHVCTRCDAEKMETIPVLEHVHSYVEKVAVPTCTEKGYTTHTCQCGDSYIDSYVKALGHEFGDWGTVKEPDYLENGLKEKHCSRCDAFESEEIPNNPFPDVGDGNSFKTFILWNYYNGIISGDKQGKFNPDNTVTRGQFIIMLWRAAGKPEPTQYKAFPDVSENSSFYKAVCWAVEKGITNGKKDGNFGVNDPCTRGHVALFLYRYAGEPEVQSQKSFPDVTGGTYYKAVCWMVEQGITNGQNDGTFGVSNACKRTHVTKFLYLYMNEG